MHNNKYSQETLWAVSIIIICILTGCFLFFRTNEKKSDAATFACSNETIILLDIDNQIADSDAAATDSIATDTISESINCLSSSIKNNVETGADIKDLDSKLLESTTEISSASYDCPIDFKSLREINEDVYAWITIPGTIIDYPILQHETDNSHYLNYTIDGIEGYPGCIYTENINAKDFSDNNTVIYGHNMRNGTMFGSLKKLLSDDTILEENPYFYIFTEDKVYMYEIFAVYITNANSQTYDLIDDEETQEDYLTYISETASWLSEKEVTAQDKIVTLSTCHGLHSNNRTVVHGVLIACEDR